LNIFAKKYIVLKGDRLISRDNFEISAIYYDAFYSNKPYHKEVSFVDALLKKYSHKIPVSLLDMGCGSGGHDIYFEKLGYDVVGVDISKNMIIEARNRESSCEYLHGDVTNIKLDRCFDVVVSLFHVINYQVKTDDLLSMFSNVYDHLNDDGIFLFDFWHGPAVLKDNPYTRVRRVETKDASIIRVATPKMNVVNNRVDVSYEISIISYKNKSIESFQEIHKLRYLFVPELIYFIRQAGFEVLDIIGWMSDDKELGENDWYGALIARKIKK